MMSFFRTKNSTWLLAVTLKTALLKIQKWQKSYKSTGISSKERERGIQKEASERGKYLKTPFILIKNEQYFEFKWDWNFIIVFSQNYDLISLPNFVVKFLSIILVFQNYIGFRSRPAGIWSCSCSLWKGRGASTRKGMPFWFLSFFSWAHALGRIWNNSREKYLKEYLLCSQFRGTVQCTIDDVIVWLQLRKMPLILQIICYKKKTSTFSEMLKCVCTASHGHLGPHGLVHHLQ